MGNKIFIKNIKYLREYLNLTQTEFGEKLGKRYNTIQNWERGRSTPDNTTIEHIKNTFNISLDWLFYDKGEMFLKSSHSRYDFLLKMLDDFSDEELAEIIKTTQAMVDKKNNKIENTG